MKNLLRSSLACGLALTAAHADSSLDQARQALADGLPSVAIHRLQQVKPTSEEEKNQSRRLLVQAYNDAGRFADTVALLEKDRERLDTESRLSLARAYVGLGERGKALPLFRDLLSSQENNSSFVLEYASLLQEAGEFGEAGNVLTAFLAREPGDVEVQLHLASLRLTEKRPQDAWEILSKLTPSGKEAALLHDLLCTKTLLALNRAGEAGEFLARLQNPPPVLRGDVLLVRTEFLRQTNDLSTAEKTLEKFIDDNPRMPALARVFQALDEVYGEQGASSGTELRRWAQDDTERDRQALAIYYLARSEARSSKIERSQQLFREFLQKFPGHPLVGQARFSLASSLLATNDAAGALEVLADAPAAGQVSFLRGLALAALERYPEAALSFTEAANTPELKDRALFNAALCSTRAGVPEAKNPALKEIAADGSGTEATQKLRLAQALYLAAKGEPEAGDLLRKLASEDGPIAQQARLALAEWDYTRQDYASAREQLRLVSTADPADRERSDYLAVFLTDSGQPDADALTIAAAEGFLKKYPDSAFAPDVRLKLGEIFFRKGDYLGARGQFASIMENSAASPVADKAAFLSAQAMARSMDPQTMEEAIETYDNVVNGGGPLALRARLAQATLFNALKRKTDALAVLDRLLASQPDPELKAMALIEKGDTQFSQGTESPENFRQAIATWQTLASDAEVAPTWRNQALTKMGAAYEKLGDNGAALNCYYNVFSAGQKGEPEYFWFYKAGFDAGHLLESQNLWNEAIAVYEKLGAMEGPRAEEARNRVNKLRLENFLWEN